MKRTALDEILHALDRLANPHTAALHQIENARRGILEQIAEVADPIGHCESCGVILFDCDDVVHSDDGVMICRRRGMENAPDAAPCYEDADTPPGAGKE